MGRPSSRFASTSTAAANIVWHASRMLAQLFAHRSRPTPAWALGPLPKSDERTAPPLGLPRRTQSLCPQCNREAVNAVTAGARTVAEFRENPGLIDAQIVEQSGRVVMRKKCANHGFFEDVLSTDPAFFGGSNRFTSDTTSSARTTTLSTTTALRASRPGGGLP